MHRYSLSKDPGSILRISESILSLVSNQMCASNSSQTYTTRTFRKIIFHKVEANYKDVHRLHYTRCTVGDVHFFDVTIELYGLARRSFLTNVRRSHHLCGLECSGLVYFKYEPH